MTLTRRRIVQAALLGGAGLAWSMRSVGARPAIDIEMRGSARGASVWFDPVGLLVEPGQIVRWINADTGNSHTATAYHPANGERPLRIPNAAEPWDSGYLLPGETYSVTLTHEGVYDFVCVPHEMAGMVGRIVVGRPDREPDIDNGAHELPEAALRAFVPVEEILQRGVVPAPR